MSVLERIRSYIGLLHLDLVKLALLVAITVVVFGFTRTLATRVSDVERLDGAEWHARGMLALEAGDLEASIDDFRRAVSKERDNRVYGLALAGALTADGQVVAAERILLSLRETAPEDPEINLSLARVNATRGDVVQASRYFRTALYAPTRDGDDPRLIRMELIRFLLDNGENEGALAELIAVADEIDEEPASQVEIANLMLQGGDADRALELFQRALATSPSHPDASAGAGAAAFRLGEFAAAARYLRRAPEQPAFADMRATAEFVLSRDPRAPRIRASERRRRLTANLTYARMQLEMCAPAAQAENTELPAVQMALDDIERRLKRAPNDLDVVDDGIGVTYRAGRLIETLCTASSPLDRALVIIGERQGAAEP